MNLSTEIEIPGVMIVYEPIGTESTARERSSRRGQGLKPDDSDQIVVIFSNN